LISVVATSYLLGVSTRRVDKLVEQLGTAPGTRSAGSPALGCVRRNQHRTLVPGQQAAFGVVGLITALGLVIALAMLGKRSAPDTKEPDTKEPDDRRVLPLPFKAELCGNEGR
jgi:hypothetical protein